MKAEEKYEIAHSILKDAKKILPYDGYVTVKRTLERELHFIVDEGIGNAPGAPGMPGKPYMGK